MFCTLRANIFMRTTPPPPSQTNNLHFPHFPAWPNFLEVVFKDVFFPSFLVVLERQRLATFGLGVLVCVWCHTLAFTTVAQSLIFGMSWCFFAGFFKHLQLLPWWHICTVFEQLVSQRKALPSAYWKILDGFFFGFIFSLSLFLMIFCYLKVPSFQSSSKICN